MNSWIGSTLYGESKWNQNCMPGRESPISMFSLGVNHQWGKSFVPVTKLTIKYYKVRIPYSGIIWRNSDKECTK